MDICIFFDEAGSLRRKRSVYNIKNKLKMGKRMDAFLSYVQNSEPDANIIHANFNLPEAEGSSYDGFALTESISVFCGFAAPLRVLSEIFPLVLS